MARLYDTDPYTYKNNKVGEDAKDRKITALSALMDTDRVRKLR